MNHTTDPASVDLDLSDAPTTPEEWDAVTITDDAVLTRILRWARSIDRQRAAIRDRVQPEIDRLEVWASQMDAPLRERYDALVRAAEMYVLDKRAHDPRVKSVATPHGTVSTRTAGGGWEVADLDALLEWAQEARPDLVKRAAPTFDLAAAKRVLTPADKTSGGEVTDPTTGDLVPGLKTKPTTVTASVNLDVAP